MIADVEGVGFAKAGPSAVRPIRRHRKKRDFLGALIVSFDDLFTLLLLEDLR